MIRVRVGFRSLGFGVQLRFRVLLDLELSDSWCITINIFKVCGVGGNTVCLGFRGNWLKVEIRYYTGALRSAHAIRSRKQLCMDLRIQDTSQDTNTTMTKRCVPRC